MSEIKPMLHWNHAQSFLMAAQYGSFSKAAEAMGLTQPTLSRQIAALESELKLTLFERLNTGLVLTEAGQQLLSYVTMMESAAQQFSLVASGASQALEGNVTISVSEIDALFRMPKIVEKIRHLAPGIALDILVSNDIKDLKRREADIALRSLRPTDPSLIARKLCDEPIWFYGVPELVSSYGEPQDPSELTELNIIGFERNNQLIDRLKLSGWQLNQSNFPITTSFQGLQWEMAKLGLGVIFCPQVIGDNEPQFTRAFPQFGPPVSLELWLVTHRELHTNPLIRQVFDVMASEITD